MVSLMLGVAWCGASARAFDEDVAARRPPPAEPEAGDARGQHHGASDRASGAAASDRASHTEPGAWLRPAAAELAAIIRQTLDAADLAILVGQAAAGAVPETDPRLRQLGAELGLEPEVLAGMLEILGRNGVPRASLAAALADIAARHRSLLERVRLLEASASHAAELRDAAAAAIEATDHDRADLLLAEAEAIEFEAMAQLPEALDLRPVQAAAIHAPSGAIAGPALKPGRAAHGPPLRGGGRAGSEGASPVVPSDRFCQRHAEHPLCERWANASPLCERLPQHPLCQGDNPFCRRHPDHRLCEQPPSPS